MIVSNQVDMLPLKRRDMGNRRFRDRLALFAQGRKGFRQIDGIPGSGGGYQQMKGNWRGESDLLMRDREALPTVQRRSGTQARGGLLLY